MHSTSREMKLPNVFQKFLAPFEEDGRFFVADSIDIDMKEGDSWNTTRFNIVATSVFAKDFNEYLGSRHYLIVKNFIELGEGVHVLYKKDSSGSPYENYLVRPSGFFFRRIGNRKLIAGVPWLSRTGVGILIEKEDREWFQSNPIVRRHTGRSQELDEWNSVMETGLIVLLIEDYQ